MHTRTRIEENAHLQRARRVVDRHPPKQPLLLPRYDARPAVPEEEARAAQRGARLLHHRGGSVLGQHAQPRGRHQLQRRAAP